MATTLEDNRSILGWCRKKSVTGGRGVGRKAGVGITISAAEVKKWFRRADLLHLILHRVDPIGWKSRITHFHPTPGWSYRICKFWCWMTKECINCIIWLLGVCKTYLIMFFIRKFVKKIWKKNFFMTISS